MAGEPERLDRLRRKFGRKLDLVSARWIISPHRHRRVGKSAKITGPLAVIQDYFLIELFDIHAKNAWIFRRISAMRMTSSEVL